MVRKFFALNLVIYVDPINRNCTEVNSLSELEKRYQFSRKLDLMEIWHMRKCQQQVMVSQFKNNIGKNLI